MEGISYANSATVCISAALRVKGKFTNKSFPIGKSGLRWEEPRLAQAPIHMGGSEGDCGFE
jgi:hypothetical protein